MAQNTCLKGVQCTELTDRRKIYLLTLCLPTVLSLYRYIYTGNHISEMTDSYKLWAMHELYYSYSPYTYYKLTILLIEHSFCLFYQFKVGVGYYYMLCCHYPARSGSLIRSHVSKTVMWAWVEKGVPSCLSLTHPNFSSARCILGENNLTTYQIKYFYWMWKCYFFNSFIMCSK